MAKKKSAKKAAPTKKAGKKAATKKTAKKGAKKAVAPTRRAGKKAPAMKKAAPKKKAVLKKKAAPKKKSAAKKAAPTITGRIGNMLGAAGEGIASVARFVAPPAVRSGSNEPTTPPATSISPQPAGGGSPPMTNNPGP